MLSTIESRNTASFVPFLMTSSPFYLFLLFVWLGLVSLAQAENADRNKPMNIEADALRYDDVKQISVFTGNVVLTKGSIVIRAARIEVRQDPDGYQSGWITGSADKPAFFRQKREGLDEYIEAQSGVIEYDGRLDTVKFTHNAQLRRLRGATVADEISGGLIVYENLTDTFRVDGGGAANKGSSSAQGGRVRAMLTPKPESVALPPAAVASSVGVQHLRSSTTLESPPK